MNQDKLWDAFQNDPLLVTSFNARPRFKTLLRRVHPGQTLLNIGVGDGSFEAMAQAHGVDVSCLDPSEKSIDTLRRKLRMEAKAQVGYANAIPFADRTFDVVVLSEVIEHLDDATIASTLQELQRVLKGDGRLIGTVPADEDLLDGQIVCSHCGKQAHRWGHVQSFSRDRLRSMLAGAFQEVRISRYYFADFGRLNWKGRLQWGLKQTLIGLGASGSEETFLFEASRG